MERADTVLDVREPRISRDRERAGKRELRPPAEAARAGEMRERDPRDRCNDDRNDADDPRRQAVRTGEPARDQCGRARGGNQVPQHGESAG